MKTKINNSKVVPIMMMMLTMEHCRLMIIDYCELRINSIQCTRGPQKQRSINEDDVQLMEKAQQSKLHPKRI